jgi:hypothetical protein
MRYILVDSKFLSGLQSKVNEMMREGWEPQGGPIQTIGGPFVQAMVRE